MFTVLYVRLMKANGLITGEYSYNRSNASKVEKEELIDD